MYCGSSSISIHPLVLLIILFLNIHASITISLHKATNGKKSWMSCTLTYIPISNFCINQICKFSHWFVTKIIWRLEFNNFNNDLIPMVQIYENAIFRIPSKQVCWFHSDKCTQIAHTTLRTQLGSECLPDKKFISINSYPTSYSTVFSGAWRY